MNTVARSLLALVLAAPLALAAEAGHAASLKVGYVASILGVPVGRLDVASAIRTRDYEIQATGKLTGLAGMFASGKGAATASGALRIPVANAISNPITRSTFQASVKLGKSGKAVRIDTSNGAVTTLSMEPPMDDRPGRIPLLAEHKKNVLDPLSALIMPLKATAMQPEDCNRTIPVFDGGARLDIVMTYSETKQADIGGYKGPAIVCSVRYVPLAGHRPQRRMIKYMENNRDMSVWLAPVAGTMFVVPLRVSVMTVLGTASLEVEKWSVSE